MLADILFDSNISMTIQLWCKLALDNLDPEFEFVSRADKEHSDFGRNRVKGKHWSKLGIVKILQVLTVIGILPDGSVVR